MTSLCILSGGSETTVDLTVVSLDWARSLSCCWSFTSSLSFRCLSGVCCGSGMNISEVYTVNSIRYCTLVVNSVGLFPR